MGDLDVVPNGKSVQVDLQAMSEQDRLQACNAEISIILNRYECEIRATPQTRAEGSIIIVDAVPRLVIKPH